MKNRHPARIVALSCLLALNPACSKDDDKSAKDATATPTGLNLPAGEYLPIDLKPHAPDLGGKGAYARAFEAAKDTFTGAAAQSRKGDFVIGNAHVRFALQGPDRHASPCPWGGNLIDAAIVRADGSSPPDEMGEYCLFFNLGRTQRAEHIEILRDGSAGGPAIIAVTGADTLDDYINLRGMASGFLSALGLKLPIDPDVDVPMTVSRFFILGADDRTLRVVTALRNDGDDELLLGVGELIDSGGEVEFFSPLSGQDGFGYRPMPPEKLDWLAFRGAESSHAFAPPLKDGGPGASYLAISGVAGILLGSDNLMGTLTGGPKKFPEDSAALTVAGGETLIYHHLVAVGDGGLSSMSDAIWQARGAEVGKVAGTVVDDAGEGVAGVRISAIGAEGRTVTQFLSDADGAFSGTLPPGAWQLSADPLDRLLVSAADVSIDVGGEVGDAKVVLGKASRLEITVRDGKDAVVPAKLTVYCDGKCPEATGHYRDTNGDSLGEGIAAVEFLGMESKHEVPLPPGKYTAVLTGGPTRSLWPADAATKGGAAIEVSPGEATQLDGILRQAVDTSGWLCGDFHVHAINSPDSRVNNLRRVKTFLADGVDVLVATDHDYITDFTPYIKQAKASSHLATIAGVEITTFDYGHFNAFPMKRDPADLTGGAIDWAGGDGPGLDPPAIVEAANKIGDGTPVVQINHPTFGFMGAIEVDILGGISLAPRKRFRLSDDPPDPKTGDTGLFTDKFTAIELLTGHRGGGWGGPGGGSDGFTVVSNWWYALLSRGVRWTGTAVSDTHSAIRSQGGGPRTWVRVGSGKDKLASFDVQHFAKAVNAGKAVGSEGPFVQMWAEAGGKKGLIGDVLAVKPDTPVKVTVDIQAPEWMDLSSVELYLTPTQTAPPPGESNSDAPKPFAKVKLKPDPSTLKAGVDAKTKRWHLQATFEVKTAADGYIVAYVHGDKNMPGALFNGRDVKPFAFTNPIFLDADGGGYNNPPLKKAVQNVPPPPPPPTHGAPPPVHREPPVDAIIEAIEALGGH